MVPPYSAITPTKSAQVQAYPVTLERLVTRDSRLLTTHSNSSIDLGQSCFNKRDIARSASKRPPV
jgi:hypothetical protein